MLRRNLRSPLSVALATLLVFGTAAIGWYAGRWLPTQWGASGRDAENPTASTVPAEESPLADQLALVRTGQRTRIHITALPLGDDELASCAAESNLEALLFDHPENTITSAGCRRLAASPKLTHLRIRGGNIDDQALAELSRLSQLEILNLPQCHCSDRGLASLAKMPRLSQLRLGSRHLTEGAAAELSRLPALAKLHLIDVPINDAGLAQLAKMPKLRSLYLDGSRVTDEGLSKLFAARPDLHVHIEQQHHDRDPQRHEHGP